MVPAVPTPNIHRGLEKSDKMGGGQIAVTTNMNDGTRRVQLETR